MERILQNCGRRNERHRRFNLLPKQELHSHRQQGNTIQKYNIIKRFLVSSLLSLYLVVISLLFYILINLIHLIIAFIYYQTPLYSMLLLPAIIGLALMGFCIIQWRKLERKSKKMKLTVKCDSCGKELEITNDMIPFLKVAQGVYCAECRTDINNAFEELKNK